MEEKDPKHDDMPQQLDIREVLLDAGYRQNRRFGLRLPLRPAGQRGQAHTGDKFVLTQDGKRCFRPPRKKEYDAVSFIKEHPQLFAEYYEGIDPDDLVEFVSDRLLPIPAGALRKQTVEPPDWEVRPFDITDYELHRFDPKKRATQKRFYTYFTYRGIDLRTQAAFHRSFCLATKKRDDGVRYTRLSFPMVLPKEAGKIVGFEERGRARADGAQLRGLRPRKQHGRGSVDRQPRRDAPCGGETRLLVRERLRRDGLLPAFIGIGTGNWTRRFSSRRATSPPRSRCGACSNRRSRPDSTSVSTAVRPGTIPHGRLEREIYCTVRDAIEQTPERKPYLDSIPDGQDLTEGEYYLPPKGGLQESLQMVRQRMGGGHVDAFEQAVRPGRRAGPNRHDEQVLPGVPRKAAGVSRDRQGTRRGLYPRRAGLPPQEPGTDASRRTAPGRVRRAAAGTGRKRRRGAANTPCR